MSTNDDRLAADIAACQSVPDLQQQLRDRDRAMEALAAENAALKVISNDRRIFIMNGVQLGYIKVPTVETDPALETIRIAVSPQEPTPATDAFINAVRAEGLDIAAMEADAWIGLDLLTSKLREMADKLRRGEQ